MKVLIRRGGARSRSPAFAASGLLHLAAFMAVVLSPAAPLEDPRPVYNREIRPYEAHIIWYNLRDKLPEIKPAEPQEAKPPRARRRFQQQIVAGKIELPRPPQLIRVPAPEIPLPRPLKMPNLLAIASPKRVRTFAPPLDHARPLTQPPLPAAPQLLEPSAPRELALNMAAPRPRPLPFIPPTPRKTEAPLTALPAAPVVAMAAPPADLPRIPHGFRAPPDKKVKPAAEPVLAAADATVVTPPAPQSTLAIVSLMPVDTPKIPEPPGAHQAGFSAGPRLKPEGGAAAPAAAKVAVPGLMAHGSTQDANAAMLAVLRPMTRERIVAEMLAGRASARPPAAGSAARAPDAPDPRFAGRAVYTISVQMPNTTSFSGSWLVWFAERRPLEGAPPPNMSSPVPLHKVDPKYYRDLVVDRIEGTVRLFAVIRKDGHVDAIEIIRGVDQRLDRSAADALAKWQFEPAKRDGMPVDVDAVFEVPFRLAPRSEK
ncbi:MAG: TonB family protein [Bryobacteraceae bacterium]